MHGQNSTGIQHKISTWRIKLPPTANNIGGAQPKNKGVHGRADAQTFTFSPQIVSENGVKTLKNAGFVNIY